MYLHIGSDMLVRTVEIIAIISYKATTGTRNINSDFLEQVKKNGKIINLSNLKTKNAKSFVITNKIVYISPISSETLYNRSKKFGLSEGLKKK